MNRKSDDENIVRQINDNIKRLQPHFNKYSRDFTNPDIANKSPLLLASFHTLFSIGQIANRHNLRNVLNNTTELPYEINEIIILYTSSNVIEVANRFIKQQPNNDSFSSYTLEPDQEKKLLSDFNEVTRFAPR